MTRYVIISEKVGTPGAPFDPPPGTNIPALVDNGFIAEVDGNPAPDSPAPTRVKRNRTPDTAPEE